jgi:hypothetical protein
VVIEKTDHHPKNSDNKIVSDQKNLVVTPCPILITPCDDLEFLLATRMDE